MPVDLGDPKLVAAIITATVALAVLLAGRVYEMVRAALQRRAVRRNLIRALYAEIDFNTRDMEIFRQKSPKLDAVARALREDPKLVPHITDARHTDFYRNRAAEMHHVSDDLIARVVHFYGLLEKLRVQIDAVRWPSFPTISAEGRVRVIETIFETAAECEAAGASLMHELERQYRGLALRRLDRPKAANLR